MFVGGLAALAGCSHTATAGGASARLFGHDGNRLAITSSLPTNFAVSRAQAVKIFEEPFSTIGTERPRVVFEGAAVLETASGSDTTVMISGLNHEIVTASSLEGHHVWVRVSRAKIGAHSCPLIPLHAPPGKVLVDPPPAAPITFAVIVDAATGAEADWSEASTTPLCPFLRDA